MVWSWLSCDPRSNLASQNHKSLSKCPRKWNQKIPNFEILVEFQIYFLGYWNNFFLFRHPGFTKDHNLVMTKPYQTKSSLLRPFFRCFWQIVLTKFNFLPFSQVLQPCPTTTLVWVIQEHLSHQWTIFLAPTGALEEVILDLCVSVVCVCTLCNKALKMSSSSFIKSPGGF